MQTATANTVTQPIDVDSLWIHIVPKGELPNKEAGIVQVLDEVALNTIMAGIDADKIQMGNRWPGIYGGREHHIYDEDQDSAALAWFKEFEKRDDGIWASARGLTNTGRKAVQDGEYKYTSFVVDDTTPNSLEKLGGNRVRVLKIDTIGFTNLANGRELLTPISNRILNRKTSYVFKNRVKGLSELSAKEAGTVFGRIVDEIQRETNSTHDVAWNLARNTEPRLFNRMGWASVPVDEVVIQENRFHILVLNRVKLTGVSQTAAWQQESLLQPDMFARTSGRIFNRAAVEDSAEFKQAEKQSGEVLKMIAKEIEKREHPDLGQIIKNPHVIRGQFMRNLMALMRDDGLSLESAFDRIKQEMPLFWQRFVLFVKDVGLGPLYKAEET